MVSISKTKTSICQHYGCNGVMPATEKEIHASLCEHRVLTCAASVASCKQTLKDWIEMDNEGNALLVRCEQHNSNALISAIKDDDRVLVNHLLDTVCTTNLLECLEAEATFGDTALTLAARHGRYSILSAILHYLSRHSNLALVHNETTRGATALIEATKNNHLKCVNVLLGHYADPNQLTKAHAKSALAWAANYNRETILHELEKQSRVIHEFKTLFSLIARGNGNAVKDMVKEGERYDVTNAVDYLARLHKSVAELEKDVARLDEEVKELPKSIEKQEYEVQRAKEQADYAAAEVNKQQQIVDIALEQERGIAERSSHTFRTSIHALRATVTPTRIVELSSLTCPGANIMVVSKAVCLLLDAGRESSTPSSTNLDEFWAMMLRMMEDQESFMHRLRHYDTNHRLSKASTIEIDYMIESRTIDFNYHELQQGSLALVAALAQWVKAVHSCRTYHTDMADQAMELMRQRQRLEVLVGDEEKRRNEIVVTERRKSMYRQELEEAEKRLAIAKRKLRLSKKKIHVYKLMSHVAASGHTLLSWASAYGCTEITELLIEHGANLGLGDDYLTWSARLIQATYRLYRWKVKMSKDSAPGSVSERHGQDIAYRLLAKTIGRLQSDRRAHVRSPLAEAYYNGHASVASILEKKCALLHMMLAKPRQPCGMIPRPAFPMVQSRSSASSVLECAMEGQQRFECDVWEDGIGWIPVDSVETTSTHQQCTSHVLSMNERIQRDAKDLLAVRATIRSKVQRKARLREAYQLLDSAIRDANYPLMISALEKGASLDWETSNGLSSLIRAAIEGDSEASACLNEANEPVSAVSFLLDRVDGRPMVDYETKGGDTALICAARHGRLENVEALLDRGASIDRGSSVSGETALHAAAGEGKARVVTLLLERGADASIKDFRGRTAHNRASEQQYFNVLGIMERSDRGCVGMAKAEYGSSTDRVPCQWGCGILDSVDRLAKHHQECLRRSYICPLCGEDSMEARNREEHDQLHCSERPVTCDLCLEKLPLSSIELHKANECQKRIVPCPREPCSVLLRADILDKHMRFLCNYRIISCPKGCGSDVIFCNMQQHRQGECPNRHVRCHDCSELVISSELALHKEEMCIGRPIECPACHSVVLQRDVEGHYACCTKARVQCTNSTIGCEWIGKRDGLEEHMEKECICAFTAACPNGCGMLLRPLDVNFHVAHECKRSIVDGRNHRIPT